MAQLAVVRIGFGAEVHIAVRGKVGVAGIEQLLHNADNCVHGFGRAGMHGRLADAEALRVRVVFLDIAVGNHVIGHAFLVGLVNHLVVDIGEILHELHLIAAVFKVAAQQVEHDERARVADVEIVVHGRAAGIHFDLARGDRDKLLFLTGQGVEQFHSFISFSDLFTMAG